MTIPHRIQLRRMKDWRKPEGAVVVARPSKWGNPFRYHDRATGLVRYQPDTPDVVEYEGRISGHGARHDWYGADGTVVEFHVRWATHAELVESFRRTLTDPTHSMLMAYPSGRGRFAKVTVDDIQAELRGKVLACWCPVPYFGDEPTGQACHADLLLELANAITAEEAGRGQEHRAELLKRGYTEVPEFTHHDKTLRIGTRVRPCGEQYQVARWQGTAKILHIFHKPHSNWARSWNHPDVETITLRDVPRFGDDRIGRWADYHCEVPHYQRPAIL